MCSRGLAIVSISDRGWEAMERRKKPATSFSYDLLKWKKMWIAKERGGKEILGYRRQPFTMPIHLVYAHREATDMILEEGLEKRSGRQSITAKALGLELFADERVVSNTPTGVRNPEGISDAELRKVMLETHGVMVSGGRGEQMGKMFRIDHMGMTASPEYIIPTMLALEGSLAQLGFQFEFGRAIEAATKVLEEIV